MKRYFNGDDSGFHYVGATKNEGINFISLSDFDAYLLTDNDSQTDSLRIVFDAHYVSEMVIRTLLGFCTYERDRIILLSTAEEGESLFKEMATKDHYRTDRLVIPALGSKLIAQCYMEMVTTQYPEGSKAFKRRFLGEW